MSGPGRMSQGASGDRVLRAAPWVFALAGAADLGFTLAAVFVFLRDGVGPIVIVLGVLAVLSGAVLAASTVMRISLRGSVLEYRSLAGQGRHEAAEISSVGGEFGTRVTLRLASGRTVELPGLGRNPQDVAKAIRSWHEGQR